jgi:hypothetical protein
MFKIISLLLVLGTLSAPAAAQRGVCRQGTNAQPVCQRVTTDTQTPAPTAVTPLRQGWRNGARSQGRFAAQGRVGAVGQGRVGAVGQGRASAVGQGAGKRGRGASRGSCQGFGRNQARGSSRGQGQGARWAGRGMGTRQVNGSTTGWQRGTCRQLITTGQATTTETAPQVPGSDARIWIARLQTVLEAELYAKEYYQAAARALNGFRRFQNLARAENNHANAIAYAIGTFGGTPNWVQNETITPPATVQEADDHCKGIELHVIDVYEGLIADAPNSQLLMIFQNIQKANLQHLSVVGG